MSEICLCLLYIAVIDEQKTLEQVKPKLFAESCKYLDEAELK